MVIKKEKIEFVLISLCTCKRPKMLEQALRSVGNLILPQDVRVELLIIDNDKDESAKNVALESVNKVPIRINYAVEPHRGIANARNRLLKEAINIGATHIAMFDDDEILDKNWLVKHIELYNSNSNALIISGPTYNKFLKDYPDYIKNNKIFKSSTSKVTDEIREICGSGNVFFPVSMIENADLYFDNTYVFMGGEDGDYFTRASKAGYAIVWNNDAVNYELVGDERAKLGWILGRYYYNGYSGALLKFKDSNNKFKKALYFIKTLVATIFDMLIILPSFVLGLTIFFNVLGVFVKNFGKLVALICAKPVNYYKNICGE